MLAPMTVKIDETAIPPLPVVTAKVMQFDPQGEGASSTALEQIVAPDEGITSEILRIANSSYYGRSGRVKTLKDAITLLGLKSVKNLVILLSAKTVNASLKGSTFAKYIGEFSIVAALVAQKLADDLNHKEIREELFLGALLHKIGMSILALNLRKPYAEAIRAAEEQGVPLQEMEQKQFGTNHVEVGKMVFDQWKLPEALKTVIAEHDFPADEIESRSDLVRITALASLTAREMMGLLLSLPEMDRRARIASHYDAAELIGGFGESLYKEIQEHPFYKQVVIG